MVMSFTAYTIPLTVAFPDQLIDPFTMSQPFSGGMPPAPEIETEAMSLADGVHVWPGPGAVHVRLAPSTVSMKTTPLDGHGLLLLKVWAPWK